MVITTINITITITITIITLILIIISIITIMIIIGLCPREPTACLGDLALARWRATFCRFLDLR